MGISTLKKMNGHSGCDVYLMSGPDSLFVRKISSNVEYNCRLERQILKQANFENHEIKTPKVYDVGHKDGLLYYDMEYINGLTFSDFVKKEQISSIKSKFKKILNFISENNDLSDNIALDVKKKIELLKLPKKYDMYKEVCLGYEWSTVSKSYSHGDLTFENIIISGEEIYFIDFLDSFTDSKILDYSKIMQELYTSWSSRGQVAHFSVKNVILDEMLQYKKFNMQAAIHMLLLNLMRIVPYSDKQTSAFLDKQISHIKERMII